MSLLNKLTIKSIKLNKKRTIVTIVGIIFSVALITAVANIFSSVKATMTKERIERYGNYHYYFENVQQLNYHHHYKPQKFYYF